MISVFFFLSHTLCQIPDAIRGHHPRMTGMGGHNGSKEVVGVRVESGGHRRCVPSFRGNVALEFGVLKFETGFMNNEEVLEG